MIHKYCWLGLAIALTGCGQNNAALPPEYRRSTGAAELDADGATARPPLTEYAGKEAPEWAEQLKGGDHVERSQAGQALAQLGEAGYPHLAEGLRSRDDAVRLAALQAMSRATMVEHAKEMIPLFQGMLTDREPMIRRSAAARICWFGSAASPALPALRQMAASDPVLDIRQVAQVAMDIIQNPKAPPARETEKPMP